MIEYSESVDGLTPAALEGGFFDGWPSAPSASRHLQLLRGSAHVVIALDGATVVGFANALSDGAFMAYIPLLEVLPAYRGRGIGSSLIERLLNRLHGHYHVGLLCDAPLQPFYERLGLLAVPGMARVDFPRQAG